jgi:hypothetical protein
MRALRFVIASTLAAAGLTVAVSVTLHTAETLASPTVASSHGHAAQHN